MQIDTALFYRADSGDVMEGNNSNKSYNSNNSYKSYKSYNLYKWG